MQRTESLAVAAITRNNGLIEAIGRLCSTTLPDVTGTGNPLKHRSSHVMRHLANIFGRYVGIDRQRILAEEDRADVVIGVRVNRPTRMFDGRGAVAYHA